MSNTDNISSLYLQHLPDAARRVIIRYAALPEREQATLLIRWILIDRNEAARAALDEVFPDRDERETFLDRLFIAGYLTEESGGDS